MQATLNGFTLAVGGGRRGLEKAEQTVQRGLRRERCLPLWISRGQRIGKFIC